MVLRCDIAVVGGGPAGLAAAEILAASGRTVTLYDRMPSLGRKLLMAGRGGLNLTHSEPLATFLARYHPPQSLTGAVEAFPPEALRHWCAGLGEATFVGSSGRVFPESFKASPLLALGGASWPRLGSDGAWVPLLEGLGVAVSPLRPANAGFACTWSDLFRERHAGTPLKRVALTFGGQTVPGEAIVTQAGLEGGAVYALSRRLREAILAEGAARLVVDLRPDLTQEALAARLSGGRKGDSLSARLRKAAGLPPVAIGLMREAAGAALPAEPAALARLIKAAPLTLTGMMGLDRAISTAGGVDLGALDGNAMLRARPGLFLAGEMLDWEAPTGGYLLQGAISGGRAAAEGMLRWLADQGLAQNPTRPAASDGQDAPSPS